MIDDRLIEILTCPVCRGGVRVDGERIVCTSCQRSYPVKNGIPVMLEEESEPGEDGRSADTSDGA